MLANYWLSGPGQIPSAALVELLEDFDVSVAGGRTTLSRLGKRGLLTSTKRGRRTFYRLSEPSAAVLARRTRELLSFGAEADEWDGLWTCVAFSIPNDRREMRPQLRTALRDLGFAGLYDGLWVSSRPSGPELEAVLAELAEAGSFTILRASTDASSPGVAPHEAFDLVEVRSGYDDFIDAFSPVRDQLRAGGIAPSGALVSRTLLTNAWRRLNRLDPDLPERLVPDGWPRPEARSLFVEIYDALADLAAARFDQVVAGHDPSLQGMVRRFTTDDPPPQM